MGMLPGVSLPCTHSTPARDQQQTTVNTDETTVQLFAGVDVSSLSIDMTTKLFISFNEMGGVPILSGQRLLNQPSFLNLKNETK